MTQTIGNTEQDERGIGQIGYVPFAPSHAAGAP